MRVIITSCLCLSIENILSICALAVSFSTLVLGFFAYRKFLSKQLKQRQLDVVCGLVEEIQKSFNIYHLKHESKLHLMQSEWKTVMDISLMPEFDRGYEKLYFLVRMMMINSKKLLTGIFIINTIPIHCSLKKLQST